MSSNSSTKVGSTGSEKFYASAETPNITDPYAEYHLKEYYQNEGVIYGDFVSQVYVPVDKSSGSQNGSTKSYKPKYNPDESLLHKHLRLATTEPVEVAIQKTQQAVKEVSVPSFALSEELDVNNATEAEINAAVDQMKESQKNIASREAKLTDALFACNLVSPADEDHLQRYGPKTAHTPLPTRVNLELRKAIAVATEKAQEAVFAKYISDEAKLKSFVKQYNDIRDHKTCNVNKLRMSQQKLAAATVELASRHASKTSHTNNNQPNTTQQRSPRSRQSPVNPKTSEQRKALGNINGNQVSPRVTSGSKKNSSTSNTNTTA